jgi:preprotein translocase subunit SecA
MLRKILNIFSLNPIKRKYRQQIQLIYCWENKFKVYTNNELRSKTCELQKRALALGEKNSFLIPESFALVCEASQRVLGIRHFPVQLVGGLILNDRKIAEMKTGEGKTLVALLPAFLNALCGKGVHVVTVNEYLACRDVNYVGQIHTFLGLTVGLVQEDMERVEKRANYNTDITYLTNNALGFDYLRDNMAFNVMELVQRKFFYCIIDEVDSILIDESRTPLVISNSDGMINKKISRYLSMTTRLAGWLKRNFDYEVDEKNRNVILTEVGLRISEQVLQTDDLYSSKIPWMFYLLNSIKAKELFKNGKNYIVNQDKNELLLSMNLLVVLCTGDDGETVFTKRLNPRKIYQFKKKLMLCR